MADFRKFAFKGNVVDLAVGVVIGAAFGKIVSALVEDFIMPLVALVMPSGDWRASGIILKQAADPKDNVVLKYGDFLGVVLDFTIVALVLFIVVSKVVKAAEAKLSKPEDPTTKDCKFCLEAIPIKATRCKACTSHVDAPAAAAKETATA
ncbi:MAG: large conductance mechanosensitive channel protein MscL [Labilithrix sp.]|nr:large conductance mechanosensitive channel protein MscL [Labilithrix sp.]